MALTDIQIFELTKHGESFETDTVRTFDAMLDRIRRLEERIRQLEAREVVHDGHE